LPTEKPDLRKQPEPGSTFATVPAAATRAKNYADWKKPLGDYLYQYRRLNVFTCAALKEVSQPGETEGEFRVRLEQSLREKRDSEVEKLRQKYAPKLAALQERIRKANERVEREKAQYGQQKLQTAISFGATLLGAFMGRKVASVGTVGRAATTMRGASRSMKEKGDIDLASENVEALTQGFNEMQQQFEAETTALQAAVDTGQLELESQQVAPRKGDISVGGVTFVWTPWIARPDGFAEPGY
jgi:hypothetical protein